MASILFYDNFTQSQVCGMFNGWHFLTIILFAITLTVALYCSRNMSQKAVRKTHLIVAICVTVAEIVKITLRVIKGQSPDNYIPLYYCSLFIFALWIAYIPHEKISRIGFSYMTMGGIIAGTFFTFYPSTSLGLYPIWHPSVFHSFAFHTVMVYMGILILYKKYYTPKASDALLYFLFIFTACIPSYFLNEALGTNCMFLRHAFKLGPLEALISISKWLYIAFMVVGQAVGIYWISFGVYKLFTLRTKSDEQAECEAQNQESDEQQSQIV